MTREEITTKIATALEEPRNLEVFWLGDSVVEIRFPGPLTWNMLDGLATKLGTNLIDIDSESRGVLSDYNDTVVVLTIKGLA